MLIGPLTFLLQGKCADEEFDRLELLDALVDVYAEVLAELGKLGAEWVQIDEPVLVEDRTPGGAGGARARLHAPRRGRGRAEDPDQHLLRPRRRGVSRCWPACRSPASALDFVRGEHNLELVARARAGRRTRPCSRASCPAATSGSTTSQRSLDAAARSCAGRPATTSSSRPPARCSTRPIDKRNEPRLDDEVLSWMSFAVQKLDEVAALARGAERGRGRDRRGSSRRTARRSRTGATSPRTRNPAVRERLAKVTDADARRAERVRRAP